MVVSSETEEEEEGAGKVAQISFDEKIAEQMQQEGKCKRICKRIGDLFEILNAHTHHSFLLSFQNWRTCKCNRLG